MTISQTAPVQRDANIIHISCPQDHYLLFMGVRMRQASDMCPRISTYMTYGCDSVATFDTPERPRSTLYCKSCQLGIASGQAADFCFPSWFQLPTPTFDTK